MPIHSALPVHRFNFHIVILSASVSFNPNNLYAAVLLHKDDPDVGRLDAANAIAPTDERQMNKLNRSRSGRELYLGQTLKSIFPGVIRGCRVQGRCIPTLYTHGQTHVLFGGTYLALYDAFNRYCDNRPRNKNDRTATGSRIFNITFG